MCVTTFIVLHTLFTEFTDVTNDNAAFPDLFRKD